MSKRKRVSIARSPRRLASLFLAAIGLTLILGVGAASASQQVINYFGTKSGSGSLGGEFSFGIGDIAVNGTGAGPAGEGDIYVIDEGNARIQRFGQDDNGTPSNPYDDTYPFLGAWGAGVDSSQAGDGYEICAVAADCTPAVSSGSNGGLEGPSGIAVDQDTGVVYVSDRGNRRINAYEGDGTFLRSFGWDVVEAGPGDAGTGYEICVTANGDVCQRGAAGDGVGQIGIAWGVAISPPDGNPATGTVFLADWGNQRVDTFGLDGSGPASFGSAANFEGTSPEFVAVDSRGIVYATDRANNSEIDRYDSTNVNGGGVGFLAPIASPPLSIVSNQRKGLEVDPDSDGAGPDTDVLYSIRDAGGSNPTVVQQFGPLNAPGLLAPPSAVDDEHGLLAGFNFVNGLGLDISSGGLFVSTPWNIGGPWSGGKDDKSGVYVFGPAGGFPSASLDSVSDLTPTTATIHATVEPNGGPPVSYRLEYSLDGTKWLPTPEVVVGSQESPQSITALLDPSPLGLDPGTLYHVRLVAIKAFTSPITSSELTFTTTVTPPAVETTGSPLRTSTSVRLEGRVRPGGAATTFHFEYGTAGSCDANPCATTEPVSAGSGNLLELVSSPVAELEPNTTYHYRLVADNGQPGSPVFGADRTVTTRAEEAPLSHGHFPGPPGSDRAWELVSAPEAGGNSTNAEGTAFADDGNSAVWELAGGSPQTDTGSFTQFYSERTPNGWKSRTIVPPRAELAGPWWRGPIGASDLSSMTVMSVDVAAGLALWRVSPDEAPRKLIELSSFKEYSAYFSGSDDGSTSLIMMSSSIDPEHPTAPGTSNLFDVSSGTPHLVNLLPGNVVSACGIALFGSPAPYNSPGAARESHWISPDGDRVFFTSRGDSCGAPPQTYMRDLAAGETKLLSPPPVSGQSCGAGFIKSTDSSVFLWSKSRLVGEDVAPGDCNDESAGGDIYRYDIAGEDLECVTCGVADSAANVFAAHTEVDQQIAISQDLSRAYFVSAGRLLPGTEAYGTYRLDLGNGDLAYVGRTGPPNSLRAGDMIAQRSAMSKDGSILFFSSKEASLNPLGGGAGNAGTEQLYRYDDNDRSLVCVSCPLDGSAPRGDSTNIQLGAGGGPQTLAGQAPNTTPISASGDVFAFTTPTALVSADQNTAAAGHDPSSGIDAYEWRDGRLLLVSDGLTNWAGVDSAPKIRGMNPSGHDILFSAATQYTPDALDDFRRIYDARIGGGFEFPKPPPPCPLEVCQGTPKGAPEEQAPGTGTFAGSGNAATTQRKPGRCAAGKRKVRRAGKTRCVSRKPHAKNKANRNRRAAR